MLCQWQNVGIRLSEEKSRRDGILLTVGFNLRKKEAHLRSKSRRDGMSSILNVVPAGLWGESRALLVRRLKSTVNNMPSLRDFSPLVLRKEGHEVVFLKIITDYLFYVP